MPLQFLAAWIGTWVCHAQAAQIEHLAEQNRVAKKYDGSAKHGPGRPRTDADIVNLILQMARENPVLGYSRIKGALANVGYEFGRNTIKRTFGSMESIRHRPAKNAIRGRHSSRRTLRL